MHLSDEDIACHAAVKRIGIGIAEDAEKVIESANSVEREI